MPGNLGRNRNVIAAAKQLARDLRKRQTKSEAILWKALRGKEFFGLKFYRQHPLFFEYYGSESFFITDFYCHGQRFAIEVDGKSHDYQRHYDELRSHIIDHLGISVLRIKNEEIEKDLQKVLDKIREFITHPKSLSW